MGFFGRLLSWCFGPRATGSSNSDASFENLVWLEPHANQFGVKVLDCRPIAQTFLSATENPGAISFFGSVESRSGAQFRGQHPDEAFVVACDLVYPLAEALREGPLFLASVMEEKWNIYRL